MATICDRVCASRNQPKPHNRQHYNDAVQGSHLATINFNEEICMIEIGKNLAETLQWLGFLIMCAGVVYIIIEGTK